jgi:hypothetical protein
MPPRRLAATLSAATGACRVACWCTGPQVRGDTRACPGMPAELVRAANTFRSGARPHLWWRRCVPPQRDHGLTVRMWRFVEDSCRRSRSRCRSSVVPRTKHRDPRTDESAPGSRAAPA